MGKKFEKAREHLSGVAGGIWLASDLASGSRDFLANQADMIIPYANSEAAVLLFVANILFIAKSKSHKAVMVAQGLSTVGAALMETAAVSNHESWLSIVGLGGVTIGCAYSGVQAYRDFKKQKNALMEKENAEEENTELEQSCLVQQFKENKESIFEKYPQLAPYIPIVACNTMFLAGGMEEMAEGITSGNILKTTVALMWVVGSACFALSKQVLKPEKKSEPEFA